MGEPGLLSLVGQFGGVFLVILGGLLPRLFGWWFHITCIELIECFYVVLCFGFMFLLERSMKQILSCPSVTDNKLPLNKTNCSLTQFVQGSFKM